MNKLIDFSYLSRAPEVVQQAANELVHNMALLLIKGGTDNLRMIRILANLPILLPASASGKGREQLTVTVGGDHVATVSTARLPIPLQLPHDLSVLLGEVARWIAEQIHNGNSKISIAIDLAGDTYASVNVIETSTLRSAIESRTRPA